MQKIGNKELIFSGDFIVPEGEQVEINQNIDGWELKIVINFDPKAEKQGLNIVPKEDHALINFLKWDNGLGTCTSEPIELGTHSKGFKIYFSATNYCIGGTNKLTFQLLKGAKHV